jgi:hypothetical protein
VDDEDLFVTLLAGAFWALAAVVLAVAALLGG